MEYISPAKRCKNVTNSLKCDIQILILIIHDVIVSSFNLQFSSSLTAHKTFTLDSRVVTSHTRGKHLKTLFIPDKSCYYSDALYSILVNGPRGITPTSNFLKMKLNTIIFRIFPVLQKKKKKFEAEPN
jgi:hypothetical protein